jgi:hypothetical protein
MKARFYYTIIFSLLTLVSWSQLAPDTYWIQFKDKNSSPFSINSPEVYLSERSIDRRQRYGIEIDSTDLPVNPRYLDSLISKGASIKNISKWLNGVAIYTTSIDVLNSIYSLDFVDESISNSSSFVSNYKPFNSSKNITSINEDVFEYGNAFAQINLHNGQALHNNNYLGQGIQIAVIDAGFQSLNFVPAFDSIFDNNQIIGTWDFVEQDTNVYDDHNHGKAVLSTIAANIPGQILGTAPKAEFLLLRSENSSSEYKIEEINWVAAAEYADSVGVNIITTSLGYHNYNSPFNDYQWSDLNGNTAPITRATNIAAEKGILLTTSAGNEGTSSWRKITCPADAEGALTIGACTNTGQYASLSSQGNTTDGRIKPDLSAVGQGATVITGSSPLSGNGTSYSTPIIAGLMACLWQVNLSKTNFEMMDLIRRHSHQYMNPDSLMGFGIPNFSSAYDELTTDIKTLKNKETGLVKLYPTVFSNFILAKYASQKHETLDITVSSIDGRICKKLTFEVDSNTVELLQISELNHLPSGIYLFKFTTDEYQVIKRVVKR